MNGSLRAAPYPPGDRTAGANDLAEVICSGIKTSSTSFGYALLIGETPRCHARAIQSSRPHHRSADLIAFGVTVLLMWSFQR
jgi:hypothetical protein